MAPPGPYGSSLAARLPPACRPLAARLPPPCRPLAARLQPACRSLAARLPTAYNHLRTLATTCERLRPLANACDHLRLLTTACDRLRLLTTACDRLQLACRPCQLLTTADDRLPRGRPLPRQTQSCLEWRPSQGLTPSAADVQGLTLASVKFRPHPAQKNNAAPTHETEVAP